MPAHDVVVSLREQFILNADLAVEIRADGEKLGELLISKGTIDWRPRGNQYVHRLDWEQFDRVMRDNGRRRRLPHG
jgi:hypothetical protein